jgi:DnaK suppressor protein
VEKKKTGAKETKKAGKGGAIRKTAAAESGAAAKRAAKEAPEEPKKAIVKNRMPAKERTEFREMLLRLRERLTTQIESLKGDSLTREDAVNSEEDGTDAFERQLALTLASSEHDSVFEIDEALQRIANATYGVCEQCGQLIEKPRLKALPFVRLCITCKSKSEGGRRIFQAHE